MQKQYISFKDTGYFSSLICDYISQNANLKPFYNRFPSIENFEAQIEEKRNSIETSVEHRKLLVKVLQDQYKTVETSTFTHTNITLLTLENTFTVTTGHQLNVFTGPLYFLYKIISTINLSKALKAQYPNYNFVPVYWMATEDHDFEEINNFNFKGKKFQWNKDASGAVGKLPTNGLEDVLELFSKDLGHSDSAKFLVELFKNAYVKHDNLADATRFLANTLFQSYGLVIIDADSAVLKRMFLPFMAKELTGQKAFKAVTETNDALNKLSEAYTIQVNPREINLFYLKDDVRERIVVFSDAKQNDVYQVLNTDIVWSKAQILQELNERPERFSPNVIMRPLYQEVILPNLCYIGGGGEIAYWMQLKSFFNALNVTFPVLLLRNSALLQTEKQQKKMERLHVSDNDVFLSRSTLINKKVREISNIDIDFSPQRQHLRNQFESLYDLAKQTDASFIGAVKAQETKQLKGLDKLEKRLLHAQKKKLSDEVFRITEIQNDLFPNQELQERNTNFSEFYLEYGQQLIPNLVSALDPLRLEFVVLTM